MSKKVKVILREEKKVDLFVKELNDCEVEEEYTDSIYPKMIKRNIFIAYCV